MQIIEDFDRLLNWIKTDINNIVTSLNDVKNNKYDNSIVGYIEKKENILKIQYDVTTLMASLLKIKSSLKDVEESSIIPIFKIKNISIEITEQLNYYSKIQYALSEQIKSIDVLLYYKFNVPMKENYLND